MVEGYPVRIILTPDQSETVRTLSGERIQAIELTASDTKKGGGPLRFIWRRAVAARSSVDKGAPPSK